MNESTIGYMINPGLNMLIIIYFFSLNSVGIYEECKQFFTTKFLSVFDVEENVLIYFMTLSELFISSPWILCFTSFISLANLLTLHSKIANPYNKYYSNILLGHFNTTTESVLFKNHEKTLRSLKIWDPNIQYSMRFFLHV